MTNLFALCLIITTLTTAGLWSPSQDQDDVIVKEGHRVVVVEYDDQGQHNTKVSISSEPAQDGEDSETHRTRDLICDVYGKCKHKIASAVEKAKMIVSETAQEAHDVGEAVADAFDEAKKTVSNKTHQAKERVLGKASELKEGAKETLKELEAKTRGNKQKENLTNDSFRYLGSGKGKGKAAMDVLGLLGFSIAFGMGVWTTFISSYVLASVVPRQQLSVVQSKIYPVYFRAMGCCIGMALLGHVFSHRKHAEVVEGYVLVAALLMIFANSVYMEPRASKVMFERLKIEKEEGRGIVEEIAGEGKNVNDNPPAITPTATATATATATQVVVDREVVKSRIVGLNKRLKKLNSYSALLNLLTLMALTWHLVYLSLR